MLDFLAEHKTLIIAAIVILLLLTGGIILAGWFWWQKEKPIALTYWGLWEQENVYQEVLADYKRRHPNITIQYSKQSPLNYRDRMAAAIGRENGPDIIRIHNSWLPMMKNLLAPAPAKNFPPTAFRKTYYPAAAGLLSGNSVYAVPLDFDALVMYVNDDLFRAAGINVPTVWDGDEGFLQAARKLTVRDERGRIKTAGAALGATSNVDHWQEILGLMLLQAGVDPENELTSAPAAEALGFFTAFAASQAVWDETLDNSTLAFARGIVGMYFGPSWRYFDIKALNPGLNFRVVAAPQLAGGETVNYAHFWAEAVSKKSKNPAAAWELLQYLASKEVLTKLYAAQSKLRGFGEPYPRLDMASLLTNDPVVGPVMAAAPTAKGWYLASFTQDGDTGINSRINKYFLDAVNGTLRGGDPAGALSTAAKGVSQVLGSYK